MKTATSTLNELSKLQIFKEQCKKHKDWYGVKEIAYQELLELYKHESKMITLIKQLCKYRHEYSLDETIDYSIGKRGSKDTFWCYCTFRSDNYLAFPSNDNNHPRIYIRNKFNSFGLNLKLNLISNLEIDKLYDGQVCIFTFTYDNKFDYSITI